jgi:hypothetical protein
MSAKRLEKKKEKLSVYVEKQSEFSKKPKDFEENI